jgi:hypothetical protein
VVQVVVVDLVGLLTLEVMGEICVLLEAEMVHLMMLVGFKLKLPLEEEPLRLEQVDPQRRGMWGILEQVMEQEAVEGLQAMQILEVMGVTELTDTV